MACRAPLALFLLLAATLAASPKNSLYLFLDEGLVFPYNPSVEQVTNGTLLCGLFSLDVPLDSMNCYRQYIEGVSACTGTHQELTPGEDSLLDQTGCNTHVSRGSVVTEVLYATGSASRGFYFLPVPTRCKHF